MGKRQSKKRSPELIRYTDLSRRAAPENKFRVIAINNKDRQAWDYGVYSSYTAAKRIIDDVPDPACSFYIHNSVNKVMGSSRGLK